jgi:hypothetical protein
MFRLLVVGFLCTIFASSVPLSAQVRSIGTTVAASDTVQGRGAVRSKKLVNADPVYLNDRIVANATGLGQFRFDDGTKLVVSSGANIVIDQYVYTGGSVKKFTLSATKGAFRWISGKGPSNAYRIVTPAGTLGVRGTVFDFTVRSQRTYLALLRGEVQFCGRSGRCETLRRPCDFIIADTGGVSEPDHLRNSTSAGSVAGIFPLLNNQRGLKSDFRVGNSCITKQARLTDPRVQTRSLSRPSPGPGPNPGPDPDPGPGPDPTPGPDPQSPTAGNPGNNKQVGKAGESPGKGNFGQGTRGKGDTRGGGNS